MKNINKNIILILIIFALFHSFSYAKNIYYNLSFEEYIDDFFTIVKNEKLKSIQDELDMKRRTYYANKDATIHSSPSLNDEKPIKVNYKSKVIVESKINNLYKVLSINSKNISGYIKDTDLRKNLYDFIDYKFKGVDYNSIKKINYKSNPRIKAKAIFSTAHSISSNHIEHLIDIAKSTNINAFVIDVKDDSDHMLFNTKTYEKYLPERKGKAYLQNIKPLIKRLKSENIYLIARIVVFKSPLFAKKHPEESITYKTDKSHYSEEDGSYWLSPYSRKAWDYNIKIAEEVAELGFNEIQFDYVRFPVSSYDNDEKLNYHNIYNESKTLAIHNFLKEAYSRLSKKEVYVTADIFGWMPSAYDDENIGQHWESMVNVVDYSAPMIYPSHYGPGTFGYDIPDANPYGIVSTSISHAIQRNSNLENPAILRPWIQDFTAFWVDSNIEYGIKELKEQIKALEDNGVDEYMLWNPSNYYKKGALID